MDLRCGQCHKKLAELHGHVDDLQIKCARCERVTIFNNPERPERLTLKGKTHAQTHPTNPGSRKPSV